MGLTDTHASTPGSTGKLRFQLERSVWCQVVAGRQSHMAGQPGGAASTNFLYRLGLVLLM
jgi:hypothetical protein